MTNNESSNLLEQPWTVEMMGGLRLRSGEREITHFKSRKVAALLAYLAFFSDRPHQREKLQELLWPDDTLDAARNSLRVALSLLRRQLEPEGYDQGSVLIADRYEVRLRQEAITTDTAQFESNYAAALHTDDDALQAARLISLVRGYRGELLPGFYEEWVLAERARLSESHLQAVRKLVRLLAAAKDYDRAVEFAREAVQLDPLREESVRDLMRLLVAAHQPSAALQQYRDLETRLNDEMHSKPAAATRELALRITEGPQSTDRNEKPPQPTQPPVKDQPLPAVGPTNRIPLPITRFFGREDEMRWLSEWTSRAIQDQAPEPERPRIITLTGPGGMGKTRLASELALGVSEDLRKRIWFVPLADLNSANQIPDAISDALRIAKSDSSGLASKMNERLDGRRALLIFDNFEHLIEGGAPLIRMLLESVPVLAVLITSRRVLGLPGEQEFQVPPLTVPADQRITLGRHAGATSLQSPASIQAASGVRCPTDCDAVQLFVDRARTVDSRFSINENNAHAVSALCRQLEGLPLAIELAAARIRVMSPNQMLTYVGRRLDLLINPNAEKDGRHRSLRAAIEWSYRLLLPDERRLFARLSVFEGGWSLDAASYVCEDPEVLEQLEQLKMGSLIFTETVNGVLRFRMLETLRTFAAEQLGTEELRHASARHASFFLAMAEDAEPRLKGLDEPEWMSTLQADHDNLLKALDWYERDPEGAIGGLRLARSLWRFWSGRGYLVEGRARLVAAGRHAGASEDTIERARVLMYTGDMATNQGDFVAAQQALNESLEIYRRLDSTNGIANVVSRLGLVKMREGKLDESRKLQLESLALHEGAGDVEGIAASSSFLGLLAIYEGDYPSARRYNERCLAVYREMGYLRNLAVTLGNLGLIAEHLGEYSAAKGLQEESLAIHRKIGTQLGIASSLSNLAIILIKLGDTSGGRQRLLEGLAAFREIGSKHSAVISLDTLAALAVGEQDWSRAAWLYGVAEGARESIGAGLPARDEEEHKTHFALLREHLGEEGYYLEFTRGQATGMDKAVDALLSGG